MKMSPKYVIIIISILVSGYIIHSREGFHNMIEADGKLDIVSLNCMGQPQWVTC